ncbi:hypothetical protein GCM10023322_43580 [Rugosimonospora acidiphila]|uniref:Protein kinase domain-containing protein n=1 Tax=Rugosimonospora acidiphila TaxID=556531 RepID=A0ABP9S0F6_9ACTN
MSRTGAPTAPRDLALGEAIRQVMSAAGARELFGVHQPERRYRQLARALHPDRVPAADRPQATDAFVRLTSLWRERRGVVIRSRHDEYRLTDRRYAGDLADLYDVGADRLLKLPRQPANNDLMGREAYALRTLALALAENSRYLPYVPRLVDSFRLEDTATGARRLVNVVSAAPGLHSLAEVRRAYPDGVDPRDVAWMWRRLLVALGFAHRAGFVHGAVLPDHVLIEPTGHGLVLIDWCYSADLDTGMGGDRIPAMVPQYAAWYPAEVSGRQDPGPGTDLAMASRCMTWLMGERAPQPLRRFAAGCQLDPMSHRPNDAWRLLAELDELLERLFGPRRFRPFTL